MTDWKQEYADKYGAKRLEIGGLQDEFPIEQEIMDLAQKFRKQDGVDCARAFWGILEIAYQCLNAGLRDLKRDQDEDEILRQLKIAKFLIQDQRIIMEAFEARSGKKGEAAQQIRGRWGRTPKKTGRGI
jgi:hypothetical protein